MPSARRSSVQTRLEVLGGNPNRRGRRVGQDGQRHAVGEPQSTHLDQLDVGEVGVDRVDQLGVSSTGMNSSSWVPGTLPAFAEVVGKVVNRSSR